MLFQIGLYLHLNCPTNNIIRRIIEGHRKLFVFYFISGYYVI